MSLPFPVTPPERDIKRRSQSVYDLEVTLVTFLDKLFDGLRLDNPTLNVVQPDYVPFDPIERMQTLTLKVPPRVVRQRIPRTVTGEIALDKLDNVPNVIVQAVKSKVEIKQTTVTVRICFTTYDEDPKSQGFSDVSNMMEQAALALTSWGQGALDRAYPIEMPIEWAIVEADTFPHYVGEMMTTWTLPSARPFPDPEMGLAIIPAEHIDLRASVATEPDDYPLWR